MNEKQFSLDDALLTQVYGGEKQGNELKCCPLCGTPVPPGSGGVITTNEKGEEVAKLVCGNEACQVYVFELTYPGFVVTGRAWDRSGNLIHQ